MKKNNQMLVGIISSVISIAVGLLFGFILLLILNPAKAGMGMGTMLTTAFSNMDQFGKMFYQAAPLLMCGLSVGFAFKTGLFNIGASGQYTIGAFFALFGAIGLQLPWWACLLLSCVGGAIWGIFPGLFKALFNVNEVITSIMFNWIGMYLVNLLLANMPFMLSAYYGVGTTDRTAALSDANPSAIIPTGGLNHIFGNSSWINISMFIAVAVAILMWVILDKTIFGYELKACGFNKEASRYAGINANRNIVLSMIIAGALSGLGGGIYYLAGTIQYVLEKSILSMGFDGIPVALLANSHPIGTIFSALFISYIKVGGSAMQPNFSSETINIIISVIIYLAAFALLTKIIIAKFLQKSDKKEVKA
ncbi:MAG: ABC transporter permease [Lachnospiraceae bacterium]|nr:ABC transporter permease [Lachnospiraceae bacterium]